MPRVMTIPKGVRGFDANTMLTYDHARAMFDKGYRFAVRYVRRVQGRDGDISKAEIINLHKAGLAVMPVQHVESESSWIPSAEKGKLYGSNAAFGARDAGIGLGTTLWLDLEGVDSSVPAPIVIAYCNNWHDMVADEGYEPGIYVGWRCGLNADQLYYRLKFQSYWAAYNLNKDQEPVIRGVQMKQGVAGGNDIPSIVHFPIDTDKVLGDAKGGLPHAWTPDEWAT